MEYGINLPKGSRQQTVDDLPDETYGTLGQKKPRLYKAIDLLNVELVEKELSRVDQSTFDTTGHHRSSYGHFGEEEKIPPIFYAVDVAVKQTDQTKKSSAHQIVETLLQFGANPDHERVSLTYGGYGGTRYHRQETPIAVAVKANDPILTTILLDYGAKIPTSHPNVVIQSVENKQSDLVKVFATHQEVPVFTKLSGLETSIKNNSLEYTQLFINNIPTTSLQEYNPPMSFLELAALFASTEIVDLVLSFGLVSKNSLPLHAALIGDRKDNMVPHLLKLNRFGINDQDKDGYTPLLEAARRKNNLAFQLLLEQGADVDAEANDGYTALTGILIWQDIPTLEDFLKRSTKHVNTPLKKTGRRPLLTAIMFSSTHEEAVHTVKLLIDHGADIHLAAPELLRHLCENTKVALLDHILEKYRPHVDREESLYHPLIALLKKGLFRNTEKVEILTQCINSLFVRGAWNGELVDCVVHNVPPVLVQALRFFEKWPQLRLLWIAYKKGNEGFPFSRLPWPLMVHILRLVGEVNHIPALYKKDPKVAVTQSTSVEPNKE